METFIFCDIMPCGKRLDTCFMLVYFLAYSSTLKKEMKYSYEMIVDFKRSKRRYISEKIILRIIWQFKDVPKEYVVYIFGVKCPQQSMFIIWKNYYDLSLTHGIRATICIARTININNRV
jgi:hypothetical protein